MSLANRTVRPSKLLRLAVAGTGLLSAALPLAVAMQADPHAGHAGHAAKPRPSPPAAAPAPSPTPPAGALQADVLDAPAPTSVEEAARATALAEGMAGGAHHGGHGSYSHVDAARVPPTSPRDKRSPSPSPRPSPSPHEHHQ
jgi:hypothetical protein